MKNLIQILAILLSVFVCYQFNYAQSDAQWIQRYNGPANDLDFGSSIDVDNSGNVYVGGRSWGIGTEMDFALIKYNSFGDQMWVKRYNGPANTSDAITSIAADDSGNIYVTGYSAGIGTDFDYTTIKYNSNGDSLWVRKYSGPVNLDGASSIAIDGSGNVYVTGSSVGVGTSSDIATIKYNSSGDSLWVRRYDGFAHLRDNAVSLAVDNSGNVYISGQSMGIGNQDDFLLIKYNSSGVEQWVRKYNGPVNSDDQATSLVIDASGNIYVTGLSYGIGSQQDYATIKYNSNGDSLWVKRYNGPGNSVDIANSITVDTSGNVCITGESIGIGTDLDIATIKYDASGVQQWIQRFNGPDNLYDAANTIGVDDSGNVYVAGVSALSGVGDYIIIKYNLSGIQKWIGRYNGPLNGFDAVLSMKLDNIGNVYITGYSAGIGTRDDIATIKYSQETLLPVELSFFSSSVNENNVTLNWQTITETNNSGFDIERSAIKDQWMKTGYVPANGNSNELKKYFFTDKNLAPGEYKYRLKQIDYNGSFEYFNLTGEVIIGVPENYELSQNFPNPFNPATVIRYSLIENSITSLIVYDITGKEVAKLVNEKQDAGTYEVIFNGSNFGSGVYFYELRSGNFVSQKRMLLLK